MLGAKTTTSRSDNSDNNRIATAERRSARSGAVACVVLWLFESLPKFAHPPTIQGKVAHIAEGDMLTGLVNHRKGEGPPRRD